MKRMRKGRESEGVGRDTRGGYVKRERRARSGKIRGRKKNFYFNCSTPDYHGV